MRHPTHWLIATQVEAADARRGEDETTSRWRLGPPGLKGLLTHASRRSMALAVVARPDTTPRELSDLTSQAGVAFDVVVDGCAQIKQ